MNLECFKSVSLGLSTNCSDYLANNAKIGQTLTYKIKQTWNFSVFLNSSLNKFYFQMAVGEIGDMLLYSFQDEGGRLAIDATNGIYSDVVTFQNDTFLGNISDSFKYRFNVFISTGEIQKYFTTQYTKYYSLPGTYEINAWLNSNGPYVMKVTVYDGNNGMKNFNFVSNRK
jgi:hypothetical protein